MLTLCVDWSMNSRWIRSPFIIMDEGVNKDINELLMKLMI
jgi:hypothetical protein